MFGAGLVGSVREKLVKSVFAALRITASHQSHRLAEAPGHGIRLLLRPRLAILLAMSLVVTAVGPFLVAVPPS